MTNFEQLYKGHIKFSYELVDRLIVKGYLSGLQRETDLIYFLTKILRIKCVTPEVLKSFTAQFVSSIEKYANTHFIPIIAVEGNEDKLEKAKKYTQRFKSEEGIICILKAREKTKTFCSYLPKRSRNPNYRRIVRGYKEVNHYYFYIRDSEFGDLNFIRISSYLPFDVTIYLNGHNFLTKQLSKRGIGFTKADNCFTYTEDVDSAIQLAGKLDEAMIRSFCDKWLYRVMTVFPPYIQSQMNLKYKYYLHQVEYSYNLIFKSKVFLDNLFQRLLDENRNIGKPESLSTVFNRRITKRYSHTPKTTITHLQQNPCIKSWYKSTYIKQYNKGGVVLRTEACTNNTHDLKINKNLSNFKYLLFVLKNCTTRYLNVQKVIDQTTIGGEKYIALTEPTVTNGQRIPGIRLENPRLLKIMEAIEKFSNLVDGFTNSSLRQLINRLEGVSEEEFSTSQLYYNLRKLRAKGIIKKASKQNKYVITAWGYKVCVFFTKLYHMLLEPVLSCISASGKAVKEKVTSLLDRHYRELNNSLEGLLQAIGLKVAVG